MGGIKKEKMSADELYAKATDLKIPFYSWHDWLKQELN